MYESKPYFLKAKSTTGREIVVRMRRQDMRVERRFHETIRWLEKRGMLVRTKLGWGELLFIPQGAQSIAE